MFVPSAGGSGGYRMRRDKSNTPGESDDSEGEDVKDSASETVRQSHSVSEKQRRRQLVDAFQALKACVPTCADKKFTKIEILNHAVAFINGMQEHKSALMHELERMNMENAQLKSQLHVLTGGAPGIDHGGSSKKKSPAPSMSNTSPSSSSVSVKVERKSSSGSLTGGTKKGRRQQEEFYDAEELPEGWERGQAPDGRLYFVNHQTQTTTWLDPMTNAIMSQPTNTSFPALHIDGEGGNDQDYGPLPSGWERRFTADNAPYYVDHVNQTTTWNDPRRPARSRGPSPVQAAPNWDMMMRAQQQAQAQQQPSPQQRRGMFSPSAEIPASAFQYRNRFLQAQQQSHHQRAASFHDYHSEDSIEGLSPPLVHGGHQRASSFNEPNSEPALLDFKLTPLQVEAFHASQQAMLAGGAGGHGGAASGGNGTAGQQSLSPILASPMGMLESPTNTWNSSLSAFMGQTAADVNIDQYFNQAGPDDDNMGE